MLRYLTCFLLFLGLSLGSLGSSSRHVFAAEAETDTQQSAKDDTERSNKNNKTDDKDSEIFVPTEEISEDFAVSFPVDI